MARASREASRVLGRTRPDIRVRALQQIAAGLRAAASRVCEANELDLAAGRERALSDAMLDRLAVSSPRLDALATAVEKIAALPDVVGRVESSITRPNGLVVERVRIPLGVVLMIYESRPNVTIDAAALCLASGNAVVLRGGSEAFHTNCALADIVTEALQSVGLPDDSIQLIRSRDRTLIDELLTCEDDIDVVIPRGGEGLIRRVVDKSRIPVLKHYRGVCHVYIHHEAKHQMAREIACNAKAQRPGVCNAAETILVDQRLPDSFIRQLCDDLVSHGVEIRGDERLQALAPDIIKPANDDDWHAEYLGLVVAMRVVDGVNGAIEHIARYGSNHTEAIVTESPDTAERFIAGVSSSTVMVNASTRFADGGELGLGAEIGISTTKLHAYGPMGLEGLTTTRFVVRGTGQIRA